MSGKTLREVVFQMDSEIRSPSKLSTSSEKVSTISVANSIIEPDTSRHSTTSRLASTSARTSRSTGRAVSNAAPRVATSRKTPSPASATRYRRSRLR